MNNRHEYLFVLDSEGFSLPYTRRFDGYESEAYEKAKEWIESVRDGLRVRSRKSKPLYEVSIYELVENARTLSDNRLVCEIYCC